MSYFASEWKSEGYSADEYFYTQLYNNFKENTINRTLPFFSKDLDKLPREISTGKVINNENSIALEMLASSKGYKSNLWIYGYELNKIQKQTGELHTIKKAVPALCLKKYFGATHLKTQELDISEAGSKTNAQYLYNLDCFDENSQNKLLNFFNRNSNRNENFQKENYKIFTENLSVSDKSPLYRAKQRIVANGNIEGINFLPVIDSHFKHILQNATGNIMKDNRSQIEGTCYKACNELINTVEKNKIAAARAGKEITKALYAGTEFQKISLSKGYNMENAKQNEEKQLARINLKKHPYTNYNSR